MFEVFGSGFRVYGIRFRGAMFFSTAPLMSLKPPKE